LRLILSFESGLLGAALRQLFRLSRAQAVTNQVSVVAGITALLSLLMIAFCGYRWKVHYSGLVKGLRTFLISLVVVVIYYAILVSIPGALAPALPRLSSAGASPWLLFVHAHAQGIRCPVHDQLRMFAPKRFGDVAVPADRKMRLHRFLELLRRDFAPLHRFPLRVNERRRVIVPMQLAKGLMAIRALLALIPATHDRCNQASPWRFLDLL
jgi:hypothetical protein